ncbi:MAG: DUF1104 domain-containing protein [Sulfurimonas sp.]|uniref:DUF1104 domain-containing protein n=1 Tax=Sulfurimonas sp. TaxID=2022749 RepID=UPI002607EC5E|nr:DUF1104 domain-containing protein [Sulfurimonas sp.]MDD5372615.1 DUF1104 domain-containing protein [Sulfurimonas sp.]
MKKVILFALLSLSVMGADYSNMSMKEMQAMRGKVPVEERAAFQKEMQSRVEKLTPQERREFAAAKRKKRPNARCATGSQMRNSATQCGNKRFGGGQGQ